MSTSIHNAAFASFWNQNFQGQECPPCPSKKEDLGLSAQVRMRDVDPILYQNLFGARQTEKLPADVLERMNAGHFLPGDQEAYLKADLDVYAGYCQREAEAIKELKRERQFAAESEAFEQVRAQSKAFGELPLAARLQASPVSEATARAARRAWGISEPL